MDMVHKKINVLMFPWLALGHVSPFLELAKKLTKRNFSIHLCSTPATLKFVKKKLGEKYSTSIQLVELHLPSLPNLPPHFHTTNGLPLHLMATLKEAFDMSCPKFIEILKILKPDLLIYDMIQPWAPKAALTMGIPAVELVSSSGGATAVMVQAFMNPGMDFDFPFSSVYFRDYEQSLLAELLESAANPTKEHLRVFDCFLQSHKIILMKSFNEIEKKYLDHISALTGKKLVPLGPLVQDCSNDDDDLEIIQWLDKKEPKSTVFVSFGSEYFLSNEDREEIAYGLELSNANFIWVVRFPNGDKVSLEEALPQGYIKRVGDRGLLVEGWAPQAKILGHSSTGGFVSHCGWNSVIESMKFGIPIIATPMHIDQPVNARLVEEVGVGLEVVRDSSGKLQREKVAAVIKQVVLEKAGDKIRSKAKKMAETISLKNDEEIDDVVEELVKLCKEKVQP